MRLAVRCCVGGRGASALFEVPLPEALRCSCTWYYINKILLVPLEKTVPALYLYSLPKGKVAVLVFSMAVKLAAFMLYSHVFKH